jgi:hypothetical protein
MGRWLADEEAALAELKQVLKVELRASPQFPGNSLILSLLFVIKRSFSSNYQARKKHILFLWRSLNSLAVWQPLIYTFDNECPELVGDRRLIRFLRGRNNNVELAAGMYREHLKWRKTNKADEIRNRIVFEGLNHPFKFPFGKNTSLYCP